MKPHEDNSVEVETNLVAEKIDMGIDADSWVYLMALMSGIYEDVPRALLREYTCNAVDAHSEAGQKRPVEVTLPNNLDPNLRIKDYGVGLDRDSIARIYSQYGASTKRGSDTQVGMFGIGCKAAVAYTNQFSVTGRKNGIETQVLVQRDGEGAGSMNVVAQFPTDEPNGVEVVIPVTKYDQPAFERRAEDIYRFFSPGSVIVNDEKPEFVDGLWLGDDMVLIEDKTDYDAFVVMGNVAYPIDTTKAEHEFQNAKGEQETFKWNTGILDKQALVAFVPIGTVTPAPSREGMRYDSEKTQAALRDILATLHKRIEGQVQRKINEAKTKPEALKAATYWHNRLPKRARALEYTFKGVKLPSEFRVGDHEKVGTPRIIVAPAYLDQWYGKVSEHSKLPAIQMEAWSGRVWVENYDQSVYTAPTRRKMDIWRKQKDLDSSETYYVPGKIPAKIRQWLNNDQIVDWSVIKAIKLPRNIGGKKQVNRISGSYDMYIGEKTSKVVDGKPQDVYAHRYEVGIPADDIDTTNEVFYYIGKYDDAQRYVTAIKNKYPLSTVVVFAVNREGKFCRDFPMARPVREGVRDVFNQWFARLTHSDAIGMKIHSMGYYTVNPLTTIKPERVNDPELRQAAKLARRTDVKHLLDQRRSFERLLYNLPEKKKAEKWENPLNKYPLLDSDSFRRHTEDHAYLYINAAHAAMKNGGLSK